jgi:hypothetical protein
MCLVVFVWGVVLVCGRGSGVWWCLLRLLICFGVCVRRWGVFIGSGVLMWFLGMFGLLEGGGLYMSRVFCRWWIFLWILLC